MDSFTGVTFCEIAQAIVDEKKKWGREVNLDAYMDVVIRANSEAFLGQGTGRGAR